MKTHVPEACGELPYIAQVDQQVGQDLACQDAAGVPDKQIIACLAGGEAGVDMADALSEYLGLLTNGTDIPNHRDKQMQQELIRKMGLRSVRQAGGHGFSQIQTISNCVETK